MQQLVPRRPEAPDAIVVVHDRLDHPLWDREAADLASAIEDRLEGVFVTTADLGPRAPRLDDALRAARFMGCRSAVVVVRDGLVARRVAAGRPPLPTTTAVVGSWSADAIAAAYRRELAKVARRACA